MRLLLSALITIAFNYHASSQKFQDFYWTGSALEWQQIFTVTGSKDSLMKAVIKSNALTNFKILDDSTLIGEIANVKGVCEGTIAVHNGSTQTAYSRGALFGSAKVEFKPNKYRVTIYNITIDPRLFLNDDENKEPLEGWYWNSIKNDFKSGHHKDDDLICFNNGFKLQFSLKQSKDW